MSNEAKGQNAHAIETELIRAASGLVSSGATGKAVEAAHEYLEKKLKAAT